MQVVEVPTGLVFLSRFLLLPLFSDLLLCDKVSSSPKNFLLERFPSGEPFVLCRLIWPFCELRAEVGVIGLDFGVPISGSPLLLVLSADM